MKHVLLVAGALIVPATLASPWTRPAQAVVLEQKWQAGQSLGYDVNLNGSLNVQVPAEVPLPIAGVPLEIELKGNGKAQMQTVSVDNAGNGVVKFRLPQLVMQFAAFGQQGQWSVLQGASKLTLNGKPLAMGQGADLTVLNDPQTGVKIGKDGKVRGLEPLAPAKAVAGDDKTPVAPEQAIDQTALITAMVIQSLPALWPGRDVQPGDTWQVKLDIPPALRPGGAAGKGPTSLGTFDMTLKGQEEVGGKTLWRVGVVGAVQVNGADWRPAGGAKPKPVANELAAAIAPAAIVPIAQPVPPLAMGPTVQLDTASQKVDGDVWFDAEAGQLARAELGLNSRVQARTPKPGGGWAEPSWMDFAGTLGLKLQPAATTAKPTPAQ